MTRHLDGTGGVEMGKYQGEVIAAQTANQRRCRQHALQLAGNGMQHVVGSTVAGGIVERFEFVQIEIDQYARCRLGGMRQQSLQGFLKTVAIVQAGEGVVFGQIVCLLFDPAQLGDVQTDRQDGSVFGILARQRRMDPDDVAHFAIATAQRAFLAQAGAVRVQ